MFQLCIPMKKFTLDAVQRTDMKFMEGFVAFRRLLISCPISCVVLVSSWGTMFEVPNMCINESSCAILFLKVRKRVASVPIASKHIMHFLLVSCSLVSIISRSIVPTLTWRCIWIFDLLIRHWLEWVHFLFSIDSKGLIYYSRDRKLIYENILVVYILWFLAYQ